MGAYHNEIYVMRTGLIQNNILNKFIWFLLVTGYMTPVKIAITITVFQVNVSSNFHKEVTFYQHIRKQYLLTQNCHILLAVLLFDAAHLKT